MIGPRLKRRRIPSRIRRWTMFTTGGKRIKQSTIRKRGTKSFEDTRKTYVTFVDKILILSFFNLAYFLTRIKGFFGGCVYITRLL